MKKVVVPVLAVIALPSLSWGWTSMIDSGAFSGIQGDLGTAGVGIMACCAIILGIGLLIRAIAR